MSLLTDCFKQWNNIILGKSSLLTQNSISFFYEFRILSKLIKVYFSKNIT